MIASLGSTARTPGKGTVKITESERPLRSLVENSSIYDVGEAEKIARPVARKITPKEANVYILGACHFNMDLSPLP